MSQHPGHFEINFAPPLASPWRGLVLALLLGLSALTAATWGWWHVHAQLEAERATRLQAEVLAPKAEAVPALSQRDEEALRREIAAVNRPVRQLNESWDALLSDMRAKADAGVRILSIAADGRSNAIRIVAVAVSVEAMADYADLLATRRSFANVVLIRHERPRDGSGFKFTIEAQWTAAS